MLCGEDLKKISLYCQALVPNPSPGADDIYKFGRPFLGHHYFILSSFYLCPGS